MEVPSPEQIKQAREQAGLTQTQAAAIIYKGLRTWAGWETPQGAKGHRKMDAAFWELFKTKITKTPNF